MRMRLKIAAAVFLAAGISSARAQAILWRDPGNTGAWDFAGTVGTEIKPPKAPYTFVREDLSGTQPKIFVRDADGIPWNVKFGYEAKVESFCWRVVRACGYFAEPSYYVPQGRIEGLRPLERGKPWIQPDGRFTNARFQYRYPNWRLDAAKNWRWDGPPFGGTKELSGLKILIMLFSNWDNKDGRDGKEANTAVFEDRSGKGTQLLYAFTDWGSGMGRWGNTTGQTDWRCADYTQQTPGFVKAVDKGRVLFGFRGDIDEGFDTNISVSDVQWFLPHLLRVNDVQVYEGLRASGADDSEATCFTKAFRERVAQLQALHEQ
ncbi:MAG TPA: hypothetical protein VJ732_01750 [Bryobacteraceae bacterium]|nr:hypothetical protein [Bryobacteraceae bacterium]